MAGDALQADLVLLLLLVLAHVLLSALEDLMTLALLLLLLQDVGTGSLGTQLGVQFALLQQSLWDFWDFPGERKEIRCQVQLTQNDALASAGGAGAARLGRAPPHATD